MGNKLNCPSCRKGVEVVMAEKVFLSGIQHIGVYCKECGRWIKWISKEEYKWEKGLENLKNNGAARS